MVRGIAILGLNGAGKSTLAHALAKELGYFEIDVEDYYFPEQKESRQWALENSTRIETTHLGKLPFSSPRSKDEVERAILKDIEAHPKFVLSGVTMNWSEEILSRIDVAFWVQAPLEVRLSRIQVREERRFGSRVLAGGDMHEQQIMFREAVAKRDLKRVEESVEKFHCSVIEIDGTRPIEDNIVRIGSILKSCTMI